MSLALAVVLGVVACALVGYLTPLVVARLPEPVEKPLEELTPKQRELREKEGPKELYTAVAALPWFAPVAMAVSGVAGGLVAWRVGASWLLVGLLPLVPVLVALSVVDLRTRTLPTIVLRIATGVALVLCVLHAGLVADWSDLVRGVVLMVIGRSFYWVLWFIGGGMGFGDVRLSALLGLVLGYLGPSEFLVGMYAGFLLLGLPGAVLALVRRDRSLLKQHLPYGPFMAAGALLGLMIGQPLMSYLVSR